MTVSTSTTSLHYFAALAALTARYGAATVITPGLRTARQAASLPPCACGAGTVIILGIDPGMAATGFGVIEKRGPDAHFLEAGVITTPAGLDLPSRLQMINLGLHQILDQYEPDHLVTEALFFGKNVSSAIGVGRTLGIVLLAAAQRGIPWREYKPSEVKLAVAGYGNADKSQVQLMVQRLLKLKAVPKPDHAADALALAICHAHSLAITSLGR